MRSLGLRTSSRRTCARARSRRLSIRTLPTVQHPTSPYLKRSSTGRASELVVVESPSDMRALARRWHGEGGVIGLVPTMGALHAGHLSLVERARAENTRLVVSVFVNPIQFGPGEDLDRYPRPVGSDLEMLRAAGVDAAYAPSAQAMYPPGATTRVLAGLVAATLEGAARPGHFEGVATVVTKLFWATRADRAYFGQKD